jgi:hypothetical protein
MQKDSSDDVKLRVYCVRKTDRRGGCLNTNIASFCLGPQSGKCSFFFNLTLIKFLSQEIELTEHNTTTNVTSHDRVLRITKLSGKMYNTDSG